MYQCSSSPLIICMISDSWPHNTWGLDDEIQRPKDTGLQTQLLPNLCLILLNKTTLKGSPP